MKRLSWLLVPCLILSFGCSTTSMRRETHDGEKSTSNSYTKTTVSAKDAAEVGETASGLLSGIGGLIGGPWGSALIGVGGLGAGLFHGARVKSNADKAYDEGSARA